MRDVVFLLYIGIAWGLMARSHAAMKSSAMSGISETCLFVRSDSASLDLMTLGPAAPEEATPS